MSVIINGTGSLTGLTTALSVAQGGTGLTSVGTSGQIPVSNGTSLVMTTVSSGAATNQLRIRNYSSGTTYTVQSDVKAFYVFVNGATGGMSTTTNWGRGGIGGAGYAEKYYASPAASYTFSIGAAGANTGTAGGTTTFDVISVTGSGGVTSTTGSSGGVGSGGDFNATGGTGGTATSGWGGGGGGGGAGRAGNGGNGANGSTASSGTSGGGGGTGGNNASGTTAGAAGTKSVSALTLPFGQNTETFQAGYNGGTGGSTPPGQGASGAVTFDSCTSQAVGYLNGGNGGGTMTGLNSSWGAGSSGSIQIIEVLK